ncbi:MAG: C4-dicarboxylate ABC transporter permease, partial [Nitrospina sp.]|nr:C4-dicarboxylate ABC transporter permease [Nitrospina sp.]
MALVLDAVYTFALNFSEGLKLFFHWQNILANLGGVLIGSIFGSIPGLTIIMAVALALPFTFQMESLTAISLLLGIYVGAIYGGSVSAILINTPGTPAAAATAMDGYKLCQKGKAGKALRMANYASCVGDLVSTSIVVIICPILANVAFFFGPPEYFALVLFSLTIIAGVSTRSVIKGLISGALGLLAATVGQDPFVATGRFTFGSFDLMSGLSFVPLLIGLFAVPEIIRQLERKSSGPNIDFDICEIESTNPDDHRVTWKEFKSCFRSMTRGGIIGLILGIIPGLGATPSAFVSYERALRNSKNPEEFGEGSLEGLAAAESGNNAVNGATFVPLLTLGIPGDIITAVMLGAFMMHNITPGPLLFEEHTALVYGIFVSLFMCDISLRIVGMVLIPFASKIAKIPASILFPIVFILCVTGSYAINNRLFDVGIMISMGVFAYIMGRYGFSPIPFMIAFVLGPMFEKGMRRSLALSDGDPKIFFSSPIAVGFILLTVISIVTLVRRTRKKDSSLST